MSTKENHSREKEKNFVPIQYQDTWKDESSVNHDSYVRTVWRDRIDDCEVPSQNVNDENSETNELVGAFAVVGIYGRSHHVDEQSLLDSTLSSHDTTSVTITSITVPTVILTRESPADSSKSAATTFLEKLIPLLTNISRQELQVPDSVPYLALDWLLNNSNFSEYSFDRQVQRFVMASFYHSMVGRSWIINQGWLTDEDECTWNQSSNESFCVNGTLRVLSLRNNSLIGFIPNDIALLSSLTYLNLRGNELKGTIPSSIGALQALTWLDLAGNELTGTIPSSMEFLTSLLTLDLQGNSLTGTIPSSIKAMRNVTALSLSDNSLSGSIPTSLGGLLHLSFLGLDGNNLNGTIPLSLGKLTELNSCLCGPIS